MKTFLAILVFMTVSFDTSSTDMQPRNTEQVEKTILLCHPTVRNIEIVRFLIEKGILGINTGEFSFLGIYHPGQTYDFSLSENYIKEQGLDWVSVRKVEGQLSEENIFGQNDCTAAFSELFQGSCGIFFFGGPDIQPEIYGEENNYSVVTDPSRHLFELSFAFHLLGGGQNQGFQHFLSQRPDYLVTGFCLGLQTLNVATGGSLYQDIPAQLYGSGYADKTLAIGQRNLHRNYWQTINNDPQIMSINFHPVKFTSHPFFGKRIRLPKRMKPLVYSSHHQAIKELGQGWEPTSLSHDGKVIEAIAHKQYPNVFSVQFHPEVPALFEDMELWRFKPGDELRTFHRMLGKQGLKFHLAYWAYITGLLENK